VTPAQSGQATVETVATAGGVLLAALVCFQLLAAGYAVALADHAAEAAAIAVLDGTPPERAAAGALPGWPARAVRVSRRGDRVKVTLLPPSPLRVLRDRLAVSAEASLPGVVG